MRGLVLEWASVVLCLHPSKSSQEPGASVQTDARLVWAQIGSSGGGSGENRKMGK